MQHTGIGAVLSILPLQPGLVQLIWALSSWPAEPWAMQSLPLLLLCRWIAPGVEVGMKHSPLPSLSLGTDDIKLWGCQIASIYAEGLT